MPVDALIRCGAPSVRRAPSRCLLAVLLAALPFATAACVVKQAGTKSVATEPVVAPPVIESGFLTDYSRLRASQQSAAVRFWRDETVKAGYHTLFVRPVSVWRDAASAGDVGDEDLQALADLFYETLVQALGGSFALVGEAGPGVLEIDVGFTLVGDPDGDIDHYRTTVPVPDLAPKKGALADGTKRFLRECLLEVEFRETVPVSKGTTSDPVLAPRAKKRVRAAFLDARRGAESPKGGVETWGDVEAVFSKWAVALDERLTALRDGTFQPKFTVGEAPTPAR